MWPVLSLVICASIVAHGMTAMPFTWLYAARTPDADEPPQDGDIEGEASPSDAQGA